MQIIKKNLYLILILFLAIFLRFYKLANVPHGMAWDEVAIGYNGFAIFSTRRDEWLNKLPISFRSFGDYKAPFAIYESGFFTAIFGMNLFAVRLPFAIHGIFAVIAIYLLFKELFIKNKNQEKLALFAAFLLAISPWHIHYARMAFESGIALNFTLWSMYFFYRYKNTINNKNLFLSIFFAVLTIYSYHSSKVTTPVLFIFMLLSNFDLLKSKVKDLIIGGLFGLFLLLPFLYDSFFAEGLTRAGATLFGQKLAFFGLIKQLVQNFLSYFSLKFLIFGENSGNFRHGDGRFGVIEPISLILIVLYLFSKKKNKELFYLSLAMLFSGLLPAIISEGLSSSNRSLLAIPGFILIIVLAIEKISSYLKKSKKIFLSLLFLIYMFCLGIYQINYYKNYIKVNSDDFVDGYLETFSYLHDLDRSKVKQIVFTNDYQHAYIYALFSFKISPIAYHGGILNLFFFADKVDLGDLDKKDTIVVASKFDQMGDRKPDKIINGSDGRGRFFIYLPL